VPMMYTLAHVAVCECSVTRMCVGAGMGMNEIVVVMMGMNEMIVMMGMNEMIRLLACGWIQATNCYQCLCVPVHGHTVDACFR
jgi:hypothetical protein